MKRKSTFFILYMKIVFLNGDENEFVIMCQEAMNKSQKLNKSLSETRWSARADALRAQVTSCNEINYALEDLIEVNDMQVTAKLLKVFRLLCKR
ncbi:UNVERIFIED_CONTAM: hypothetical protein NCL1_55014 [Trichonephila clavipes]